MDNVHEKLKVMGADVLEPPQEYPYVPGYYAVFFRDPHGMKLQYVQYRLNCGACACMVALYRPIELIFKTLDVAGSLSRQTIRYAYRDGTVGR